METLSVANGPKPVAIILRNVMPDKLWTRLIFTIEPFNYHRNNRETSQNSLHLALVGLDENGKNK